MKLRKLFPGSPWEILEGYNQWKPIPTYLAEFLLEDQRKEKEENERKKVSDSRDIHEPAG
jgi:hypothetical protein